MRGRVIKLHYSPGKFISATDPESAIVNENLWIGFEEIDAPFRKFIVRQISGLIARRIVCDLRSDEVVERGYQFGMIKLGSRTELILPWDGLKLNIKAGETIKAGTTIMGHYPLNDNHSNGDKVSQTDAISKSDTVQVQS